jgi:poly-gamma-glutamate capsule biosynthesis protein CapA/YwtB (metallophosphatase superfamily)
MTVNLIVTGDVNLMNVDDPAVPLARVADEFRATDMVFSNLECCLYAPSTGHSVSNEGFFADPKAGEALNLGGVQVVGIANNVHYGEAAILASIARLDELGVLHAGAGHDLAAARAPVVVERNAIRYGFLQRSSVCWPTNHEAGPSATGIAVVRAHTAYQVPMHKTRADIPPMNRPGIPPVIITWADPDYLHAFTEDISALRSQVDILVASCHWGLHKEVLGYMREIGRAAIDAGADLVIGHGPHYSLPIEVYRGRSIFYGLGSFSFHTGHGGRRHGDWIGMLVRATTADKRIASISAQFIRHNDRNETVPCRLDDERAEFADIKTRSVTYGTRLIERGDEMMIALEE